MVHNLWTLTLIYGSTVRFYTDSSAPAEVRAKRCKLHYGKRCCRDYDPIARHSALLAIPAPTNLRILDHLLG